MHNDLVRVQFYTYPISWRYTSCWRSVRGKLSVTVEPSDLSGRTVITSRSFKFLRAYRLSDLILLNRGSSYQLVWLYLGRSDSDGSLPLIRSEGLVHPNV